MRDEKNAIMKAALADLDAKRMNVMKNTGVAGREKQRAIAEEEARKVCVADVSTPPPRAQLSAFPPSCRGNHAPCCAIRGHRGAGARACNDHANGVRRRRANGAGRGQCALLQPGRALLARNVIDHFTWRHVPGPDGAVQGGQVPGLPVHFVRLCEPPDCVQ